MGWKCCKSSKLPDYYYCWFSFSIKSFAAASSYKTNSDQIVEIDKTDEIMFSGTKGAASDIDAAKAKTDALLK